MELETLRTNKREGAAQMVGIMDISELSTEHVQSIVADEEVYLERRGDRTFLVPA